MVVWTVASHVEHANEMDTPELHRTSLLSAARALTTNRSMFPKDLTKGPQDSSRTNPATIARQRDLNLRPKPLDEAGPVAKVPSLISAFDVYVCVWVWVECFLDEEDGGCGA